MRPVVLVHGWGCDPKVWDPLLEALPGSGHQLVDLNPLLQKHESVAELLAGMAASTPEGALWIGSSLGGTLCSLLSQSAPEHVGGVVTIGTNPCFVERDDWSHAMDETSFTRFLEGLEKDPLRTCQRFQALATQGNRQALRKLGTLTSHLAVRLGVLRTGLHILRTTDLRDYWRAPARPHLAVFGSNDALVPASAAQAVAHEALQTRVLDADHLPWITEPERMAEIIAGFAQEHC